MNKVYLCLLELKQKTMKLNLGILILLLLLFAPLLFSEENDVNFYDLSMKNGLSSNEVNCIFKDSKGFMWFGTNDGLNRYDGIRFTTFKNQPSNSNSIGGNKIRSIVEDHLGGLWISCDGGLVKFDRETESFKSYRLNLSNRLAEKTIGLLYSDGQGCLWVTLEGQTIMLDPKTGKTKDVLQNKQLNEFVSSKTIINFFEDSKKNLWLSAWGVGLIKLDADRNKITLFKHNPNNANSLSDNNILTIYEDKNQRLWMGTFEHGLSIFDPLKNQFTHLKSPLLGTVLLKIVADRQNQLWICQGHSVAVIKNLDPRQISQYTNNSSDLKSFTPDFATTLYKDNTGIMWFGTSNDGVCYHDPNETKFSPFSAQNSFDNTQKKYYVRTFGFSDAHNVLIGTFNGLLNFNSNTNRISTLTAATSGLASDDISSICTISSGQVWLGTSKGISILDSKSQKTVGQVDHKNGLSNNSIVKLYADSRADVWVATEKNLGLFQKGRFIHFNQNGLGDFKINDIVEDRNGNVWIATAYGLHRYLVKTKQFTQYFNVANNKNSLSSSEILSLMVDAKGVLWVGTRNGLNYYKRERDTFAPYSKNREIADRPIYRIVEDNETKLWLGSNPELYRLNSATGIVKAYDDRDGLLKNTATLEKGPDGKIYVGGKHTGFYCFQPSEIVDNPLLPRIVITGFLMNNKRVPVEPNNRNATLSKSISYTTEISLDYNQSMLEFELAALNYTLSGKNRFAYKLEGLDNDWILLGAGKSTIPFTYLPPGKYTLRVKGSNNDGLWNEKGVSLKIIIKPPFWQSDLAYFFYFLLAITLLLSYRLYTLNRFRENTKAEIDQLKLHFFANVSHELRTPLTLIAGPLSKLIKDVKLGLFSKEQLLEQFSMMQRNTERLLLLTNQLLDLQKTETGTMKLNLSQGNVLFFLQSLFESFVPMAEEKNIQFNFSSSTEKLVSQFDADKLEKIVVNLLSNAFKFTKSVVKMTVKVENEQLVIEVEDDGIGIERNELQNIFQNFYQVDSSIATKNNVPGTGIGLALARELVLLHKGTIDAESELGKGSLFRVVLPVISCQLSVGSEQLSDDRQRSADDGQQSADDSPLSTVNSQLSTVNSPLILIVEDNADMRLFIRDILKDNYRLIEAENGKAGLQKAIEKMPDLIVSDVMMPEMNGMELCQRLKSEPRTSHIPVVLLTALSATESKLKGLQTGADDYVTKPFHAELLLVRIKNLIESRRQLQLKFKRLIDVDPSEVVTNVPDEKLLKKAIELVENNMENLDFGIQQFIEGMHVSRRGLYDKLKAITGMTISEFINSIRLRRAAKLMLTKEYTISEITFKVGFQNRSQLNRAFNDQFSMSPTEYIRSHEAE